MMPVLNTEGEFEIIRAKMRAASIYLAKNALVFLQFIPLNRNKGKTLDILKS